ncbi:hypothetical protein BKA70DRAFT_1430773 [Coprinopsis sp. MPI-PUGE-AT-0042]|nr:hypothetical protein BKA70DRAFT_1430773 [Coprinopsis sp. MPI-PUGE-AT-0042]
MLGKGATDDLMVFPTNDYGKGVFTLKLFGAERFRYSDSTFIEPSFFKCEKSDLWEGVHVIVPYRSRGSSRTVPRFVVCSPFSSRGFDEGINRTVELNEEGEWELEIVSSWPIYVQLNVFEINDYFGPPTTKLQIAPSHEAGGWSLHTVIISFDPTLSATSLQLTLVTLRKELVQRHSTLRRRIRLLYCLHYVALAAQAQALCIRSFNLLDLLQLVMIRLPTPHPAFYPVHYACSNAATWSYPIASAAGFLFFGLSFGEEGGAASEIWPCCARIVQDPEPICSYIPPRRYIGINVFPLVIFSFLFAYLMFYDLRDYYL